MKNQTIQIRISEDLKNRLKAISKRSGIPMSKIIVKALEHEISVDEYYQSDEYLNPHPAPEESYPEYERHKTDMDYLRDDVDLLKEKVDLILEAIKK